MGKSLFILIIALLIGSITYGQKHTITGYISDSESGEKLIGATIYEANTLSGTASNPYGFYSLTLPAGEVEIVGRFVGFKSKTIKLNLQKDTLLNLSLSSSLELKTVEISASKGEEIAKRTEMSTIEIPVKQLESIPTLMGERDVLKVIQLLPGVQSGSEGSSGFYVRGGGPDQNLILLDGVPVYNASHLFGFFSVFNPDAINNVKLVKGGFPARYGGRLSSVLDIRMKEGNSKEIHGSGSIGLVSSKLTLEGPIKKDKTSFIVSARRTYIDLLARPLIKNAASKSGEEVIAGYYFYDVNAKVNHKINDKHRLFLSAYTGNDKAYFESESDDTFNNVLYEYGTEMGLKWGNLTTALRWNYLIGKKLFANTTITYSKYNFKVGFQDYNATTTNGTKTESETSFEYLSGIKDVGAKIDFDYLPNPNHYIKFGVSETYHTFTPGVNVFKINASGEDPINLSFGSNEIYSHEVEGYIEDDFRIGSRLKLNTGLHYSNFIQKSRQFQTFQPRIAARLMLTDKSSLKASFATMSQFLHLLTNSTIGLPTDLWVPSTEKVKPQQSQQIALGFAQTLPLDLELSVEGYYKTMQNLIEYKEGASFFTLDQNWDNQIEQGDGTSYGGELLVQRKEGKTSGWVGYTLSWTNRQFENLNFGRQYPYKYDRRHDISIVLVHQLKKNIEISGVWVYGTGNALTLANTKYLALPFGNIYGPQYYEETNGKEIEQYRPVTESYKDRNSFRMPSYHRLDIGVNFTKEKKRHTRVWSFGLYNAYSRKNPFFIYNENRGFETQTVLVSLFPVIPYFTYNFKF